MPSILDGGIPSGFPVEVSISPILQVASLQLKDAGSVRAWDPATVLVPYLNLGLVEIIRLRPDAYPVTDVVILEPGCSQSLPEGAFALIDAVCNMGIDGETQGRVIRLLKKDQMDSLLPDWMVAFPDSGDVMFVIENPMDPLNYYVFPPQPEAVQQIKIIYSAIPDVIIQTDAPFPLDDSYRPAMVDYLVYRCLSEETTIVNALNKASIFYEKFLADLGISKTTQRTPGQVKTPSDIAIVPEPKG